MKVEKVELLQQLDGIVDLPASLHIQAAAFNVAVPVGSVSIKGASASTFIFRMAGS